VRCLYVHKNSGIQKPHDLVSVTEIDNAHKHRKRGTVGSRCTVEGDERRGASRLPIEYIAREYIMSIQGLVLSPKPDIKASIHYSTSD